jgi:hypothetical protein
VEKQALDFLFTLCRRRELSKCYLVMFNGDHLRIYAIEWPAGPKAAALPNFYGSELIFLDRDKSTRLSVASVLLRMSCIPDACPEADSLADIVYDNVDESARTYTPPVGSAPKLVSQGAALSALNFAKQDVRLCPWAQEIALVINGVCFTQCDVLGVGLSSKVAIYSNGTKHFVLKRRLKSAPRNVCLSHEADVLGELKDCGDDYFARRKDVIPEILRRLSSAQAGRETITSAISIAPRCAPLTSFVADKRWCERIHDLVSALFIAAECGFVHRDVRQMNIMLGPCDTATGRLLDEESNRAFLIDWGFAVKLGVNVVYEGTARFASQRILELLAGGQEVFEVFPDDDAVSLVKTLFFIVLMSSSYGSLPPKSGSNVQPNVWRATHQFWKRFFDAHILWCSAFTAALACREASAANYKSLEQALCKAISLGIGIPYNANQIGLTEE